MDMPSTSLDIFGFEIEDELPAHPTYANVVPASNDGSDLHSNQEDPYPELLGLLEAQIEFCDQLLFNIEVKRKELAEKKALIEKKMEEDHRQECSQRNRVPVIQYLPPYFKDENMMCPPMNEEAKHKLRFTTFDPLIKEDKKWTLNELRLLRDSVKKSVIQAGIQKFIDRKEILRSKIQEAGADTSKEEINAWMNEIDALDRKIQHSRAGEVDSQEMDVIDYSCVDWLKISTVEFKGTRSALALRYKWLNEQCPRWNSGPWTKQELERLRQLREETSFTSWAALAKKLGTERSPYQCFERYRSDMYRMIKDWTKEEDDRLVALVKVMTVNGSVQWDKVCFYMPGRHRQQVRTRYLRTLDENVRHGRWTDHEDLLLMSAVARFGAKDWAKVAKAVVGRSDGQCRERWCNVLDRCTETGDWTAEEDERLVFGVQVFGRGQWSKIAEILPRHTSETIRRRYHCLIAKKMRLCSAKIVGYPVIYNMSDIAATVHKAKRDVLRQQLTDNGLKGECYRAAKEQAQKHPSKKVANVRLGNKFTDEEKAILEKGVEEISKKFKSGGHSSSVNDVMKKIDLTQKEVASIITAAKKCTGSERRRRIQRNTEGSNVRKIRKNMYLLPISHEKTEFEPEETEESRVVYTIEALCYAVRRYDHYEWCNRFSEGRDEPENIASGCITDMLISRCVEVASNWKQCIRPPLESTLAPTFTTASTIRVFERARLSLTQRASCYFYPTNINRSDILVLPEGDVIRKFTVHDRLNIRLHPDILKDDNYLQLKARVRCIFFEPTRLAFAIDSQQVEQIRNQTQMELMQTIMNEQVSAHEDQGLHSIESEIVISTTEECEPIDYEDAVDDALNETVHTVIDQVCNLTVPQQRKRRRPQKEEGARNSSYDSIEDAGSIKRRTLLPRAAKKSGVVIGGGNNSDGDDLEPDILDDGVISSEASKMLSGDSGIAGRAVTISNANSALESVEKSKETQRSCSNSVVIQKRKRGRPRKTVG